MQLEELQFTKSGEIFTDKKLIHIVDDDESVCSALKVLMVTYGFEVRTFFSAEEYFSAVPNSAPGCLILDIYLPGMDGWEAQRRLLKSGSKRPIIIMTADKNDRLKEQAFKIGVVGFLQKPFQDHELVCFVNKAYRRGMV
jgi:two-component system response regulator FixJ